MSKIFISKTKYFFNFLLLVIFLFQLTLPTIENKKNIHINFGELIFNKCNDPKHSHPPLSKRKSSNEPVKFVNSDLNNLFFINKPPKLFNISGENSFKKFFSLPELSLALFTPARGPPYFEV